MTFSAVFDFYPRPPRGGRPERLLSHTSATTFLSTPSARRATKPLSPPRALAEISIHALREEGDFSLSYSHNGLYNFYPRPLRGGRLDGDSCTAQILRFLSTPSARRATNQQKFNRRSVYISIHALCEEGDGFLLPCFCESGNFYPRPLRGGRLLIRCIRQTSNTFLSTPSARRATGSRPDGYPQQGNFYPRPLRGGRPDNGYGGRQGA